MLPLSWHTSGAVPGHAAVPGGTAQLHRQPDVVATRPGARHAPARGARIRHLDARRPVEAAAHRGSRRRGPRARRRVCIVHGEPLRRRAPGLRAKRPHPAAGPRARGADRRLAVAAGCRRTASGGAGADVSNSAASSSRRMGVSARSTSRACARAVIAKACSCRRSSPCTNSTNGCGPDCGGTLMRRATVSDSGLRRLTTRVAKRAAQGGLMIVTAESCTGGLLAKCLTDIAGSSDYFDRGWVTYSNACQARRTWRPGVDARAAWRRQRGGRCSRWRRGAPALERARCDRGHRHRGARGRDGREARRDRLDRLGTAPARSHRGLRHPIPVPRRPRRRAPASVVAALKGLPAS